MKEIQLANGKGLALVDDEDFARFGKLKWYLSRGGYAVRSGTRKEKPRKKISLHQEIVSAPETTEVDHINRNRLDCRKKNLRVATHSQNMQNASMHRDNTSGYVGVTKHEKGWTARICHEGRRTFLGRFSSATDAAAAYDNAKIKIHGPIGLFNNANEA